MSQHPFRVAPHRLPLVLLALTACADRAPVHIHVSLPSGVPVEGLEVSALPFNADRVMDSLAFVAETPSPSFPDLELRLRTYQRPGRVLPGGGPTTSWLAIRDSVARLARELKRQDRRASGYRESYARFRQLYMRYTAQEAEREKQVRGLFSEDLGLAAEATRASDSLRAWERTAYHDFPSLADQRVARLGRAVTRLETDSLGRAEAELPNGNWWVSARIPDPDNPFEEYRWNVAVRVTAGLPVALPLMRANASQSWRH